jgi:hypothetical protein
MKHVPEAIGGALTIAAVSTLGDYLWANWITDHRAYIGLAHGVLLFLCVGAYLGAVAGQTVKGAIAGPVVGLLAAASYYVLAPLLGRSAMFVAWVALWVALGSINARLRQQPGGTRVALLRCTVAAVASGIAFYAISGIWAPLNPQGWVDYAVHFLSWTLAYLPAFGALLVEPITSSKVQS